MLYRLNHIHGFIYSKVLLNKTSIGTDKLIKAANLVKFHSLFKQALHFDNLYMYT